MSQGLDSHRTFPKPQVLDSYSPSYVAETLSANSTLTMTSSKTLLVVGSGPGIGRAVTTLFASKRYNNVVLVARRAGQLNEEEAAVKRAVGPRVNVRTLAVDITQTDALFEALDEADAEIGKPECVFFNAARVLPSALLDHDVKEVEYDFKVCTLATSPGRVPRQQLKLPSQITISSLYAIAQRYLPHLVSLAKEDESSKPALLVTSSMLPMEPIPELFALSLVKAAQRNLVQCLDKAYGPMGVHIGVVNVSGPVAPSEKERNPTNIAAKTWEWFEQGSEFEVVI